MNIARSHNRKEIISVVESCFNDIAEDETTKSAINVDTFKDCWMRVFDDQGLIGFFQFSPYNNTVLKVHPFILKERRNLSKKAAFMAKSWFNKDAPKQYLSLVTQTASFNRHIVLFLLSVGFKKSGMYESAFKKNGEIRDLYLFQLVRG